MTEISNVKVMRLGIDARPAQQGLKQLTSAVRESMNALRAFDKRAHGAFDALRKMTTLDTSRVAKHLRGTAQALETLNRVKISKSLITNLQMLQQTLRNFRFNLAGVTAIPAALNALNRIRIDSRLPTVINQMKASLA